MSRNGLIEIDDDAAGWGWFIAPTPKEDSEFDWPSSRSEERPARIRGTDQRIDLLTVVMHELGHELGLVDRQKRKSPTHLMGDQLLPGVRRYPQLDERSVPASLTRHEWHRSWAVDHVFSHVDAWH